MPRKTLRAGHKLQAFSPSRSPSHINTLLWMEADLNFSVLKLIVAKGTELQRLQVTLSVKKCDLLGSLLKFYYLL